MSRLASIPVWLWAVVGFLVGSTVIMVMPRSWLFVEQTAAVAEEGEVWACPMLCVKLDQPGTCPVCGMDLERFEDTGETLVLNERERELIDLATAPVERRVLTHELRTFGRLEFNQRRVERISAWVPGRVTRLFADTVYTDVRSGDHLFEIYSPELFAAQAEFLAARGGGGFGRSLASSTREKLSLYGLTDAQIDAIGANGEAEHKSVIHSPATGTIFELHVREGDYVKEGSPLYTIADYSTLWLLFDAYEGDLPWLAHGQEVEVALEAFPGRTFPGTIEFIDKAVASDTRTIKVRVVLDNPDHALKPGMFASVVVKSVLGADGTAPQPTLAGRYGCYMHPEVHLDEPGECPICGMPVELHSQVSEDSSPDQPKVMAIPRSAVLETGERQLVYVMIVPPRMEKESSGQWTEVAAPEFEAREVVLGARAGEYVAVVEGLRIGDRVVTNGAFLVDSQMQLLGKPSLLSPGGGSAADPHAGH